MGPLQKENIPIKLPDSTIIVYDFSSYFLIINHLLNCGLIILLHPVININS